MALRTWFLAVCVVFSVVSVQAQQTVFYDDVPSWYRQGVDLFTKEMYGAAQKKFEKIIRVKSDTKDEIRVNAEYYRAYCALELFNGDAELMLVEFMAAHPESQWINRINFLLGRSAYRKKDYDEVVKWLQRVDKFDLNTDELVEYQFKLGYSYFMLKQYDASGRLLYEVKNGDSEYTEPAIYYFAHIAYAKGNYETALKEFNRIKDSRKFKVVVPYYLAQIYYSQKRFDELLSYCLPLLENGSLDKRADEVSRLIGEAYYYTEDYEEALPFLETSITNNNAPTTEDLYQMGYVYFRNGQFKEAVSYLSKAAAEKSKLGQTASYQLGECYVKLNNKPFAKNAFKKAASMNYDKVVTEDALFNFAKLAYELSYNPYNDAIEAFERYLNDYPDSENRDEANEYLVAVYMTTRNYEEALASLDRIGKKDFRLQTAYQVIAFNRGVELFLNKNYEEALVVFRKVQKYPFDKKIEAESLYWIAECYYRTRDYQDAMTSYRVFKRNGAAYNTPYYAMADYNLGYAYFKLEKYSLALPNFRTFTTTKEVDFKMRSDAYIRLADCYFVDKKYDDAISNYNQAIKNGVVDVDYALYQKALCHGFKLEYAEKSVALNQLISDFPNSEYDVNARYELGEAYFKIGSNDKALQYFEPIVNEYEGSPYFKKALLQIGLIHYRKKEYDKALNNFKRIAEEFPSYQDAKDAIARAQDVYVETGRINEYNDWVESLEFYDVSKSELDSVNFRAAENIYLSQDCEKAVSALGNYIERFSPGIFSLNAHYYMAECYLKLENDELALDHFSYVAAQPVNKFSEAALVSTASLNYNKENYTDALKNYMALERVAEFKTNVLEAQIGQMRCLFKLEQYQSIVNIAELVLLNDKTPDDIKLEAMVSKAKALNKLNEVGKSIIAYQDIIDYTTTEASAEARFSIVEIYFKEAKYDSVESKIFQMVHAQPSYDHWNAKAFIMLADMYFLQGDAFQAKATLQSIIDYHDGPDLVKVAKDKMAIILQSEMVKEEQVDDTLEINIQNEGGDNYDKLFDDTEKQKDVTPKDDETKELNIEEEKTNSVQPDSTQGNTNQEDLPNDDEK